MTDRMDVIGQNGNDGLHYKHLEMVYGNGGEEQDPDGIDPHSGGAKLDAGKPRVGLVLGGFARALREVSKVGTFGANKYSADGWKSVAGGMERYTDAMLRHFMDEAAGEAVDKDSQCLHAAQVAWNALARLEFILQEMDDEDRSDRKPNG